MTPDGSTRRDAAMPGRVSDGALRRARLLWAMLLLTALFLFGAAAFLIGTGRLPPSDDPQVRKMLLSLSAVMFALLVPMAYLLRRHIHGHALEPRSDAPSPEQALLRGVIAFGAMCEAAALIGLVAAIGRGTLVPTGLFSLAAIAVQALHFPRPLPDDPGSGR